MILDKKYQVTNEYNGRNNLGKTLATFIFSQKKTLATFAYPK